MTEPLLSRGHYIGILYVGLVMGALSLLFYVRAGRGETTMAYASAAAFSLLALSPLFHAASC